MPVGIIRAAVYGQLHGQAVVNVFHTSTDLYLPDSTPGGGSCYTVAHAFQTSMHDAWLQYRSPDYTVDHIECRSLVPFGDGLQTISLGWAGTAGASGIGGADLGALPGAMALVLTLRTAQPGRAHRGRLFLTGWPKRNDATLNGLWNSFVLTGAGAVATQLLAVYGPTPVVNIGNRLVVWSRKLAGATPPFSTSGATPVTAISVQNRVRVQRRREIGVGA
jgi:hypothetical protein